MTNYRIGPHRSTSDYVWQYVQTRDRNFKSKAKMHWVNKPSDGQLSHYKLGHHKSSIGPRSLHTCLQPSV